MLTKKQQLEAIEHIIKQVTHGLGNIHFLAPYATTLSGALDIINSNTDKANEFERVFAFKVEAAIAVAQHAPGLRLCDIVLERFVNNTESPFDRVLESYKAAAYTGGVFDI